MPSTWKGKTAVICKRRHIYSERGIQVVLTIGGTYEELQRNQPPFGYYLGWDYGFGFIVEHSELVREGEGRKATLTITASNRLTAALDLLHPPDPTTMLEKEWMPIEVALRKHPNFNPTALGGNGRWLLTIADDAQIAAWEKEDNAGLKAAYHWLTASNTLSANAQQYAIRIARNQLGFNVYLPAAKRTRFYASSPATGGCGHPENAPAIFGMPTVSGNGQPYYYIKTEDRAPKQGLIYERQEAWIGFIDVDLDIIQYV
ncbi:MAG: hypothetical protein ABSA97_07370 [Verrucomicrobiia bacterium]